MGSEIVKTQKSGYPKLLDVISFLWNNRKINYKNISGVQVLDNLVLAAQKLEEQLTTERVSGFHHRDIREKPLKKPSTHLILEK